MKKHILLSILVLIMALGSCKTSLEVNDPQTLSLSVEGSLLMLGTGEKAEVTVKTDSPEWSFLGGADWLDISKEDNRLVLTALPNLTVSKRSVQLIIMAGEISQSLWVEQDSGAAQGGTKQSEITVDQWEDLRILTVDIPYSEWDILCSASGWITHVVNPRKRELRINVSENKSTKDRTAVFYISTKSGEGNYKIKLTQRGAMSYILPYPGFNETEVEVRAFEDARRSLLIGKPSGTDSPMFGGNANVWTFETQSKTFGQIQYIIEPDERLYRAAIVWANDPMLFRRDRELDNAVEFLQQHGFVLRRNTTYYSEKLECTALIGMNEQGSFIMYTFEPKQPAPADTFESFPWGILEQKEWRTYREDAIDEWETQHGGKQVFREEKRDEISLAYASDDLGGHLRIYTILTNEDDPRPLTDVIHVYTDTSRVYYKVKGAIMLTREFAQLARSVGFVFRSYVESRIFMYEHPNRGLYMGVYRILEKDPNNADTMLEYAKMEFLPIYNTDSNPQTFVDQMQEMKRQERREAFIAKAVAQMSEK